MDSIKQVILTNFRHQEKRLKLELRALRMELDYSAHGSTQHQTLKSIAIIQRELEFVTTEIAKLEENK